MKKLFRLTRPMIVAMRKVGLLLLLAISLAVVVGFWLRLQSGKVVDYATLRGHKDDVTGLAFTLQGQRLISSGCDGKVLVWDVSRKEVVATVWSHSQPVTCFAMAEDGETVAAGSYDGRIIVWDTTQWKETASTSVGCTPILAVAVSASKHSIAVSCDDKTVRTWDWTRQTSPITVRAHADACRALAYSADGRLLAMGCRTGQAAAVVLHLDLPIMLDGKFPCSMSTSFFGDTHLVVGERGELWDGDSGARVGELSDFADRVATLGGGATAMTTGSRRNLMVIGDAYGQIYVWEVRTRKLLHFFKAFKASTTALALSEDGRLLAAGCTDIGLNDQPGHSEIKIWKLPASD